MLSLTLVPPAAWQQLRSAALRGLISHSGNSTGILHEGSCWAIPAPSPEPAAHPHMAEHASVPTDERKPKAKRRNAAVCVASGMCSEGAERGWRLSTRMGSSRTGRVTPDGDCRNPGRGRPPPRVHNFLHHLCATRALLRRGAGTVRDTARRDIALSFGTGGADDGPELPRSHQACGKDQGRRPEFRHRCTGRLLGSDGCLPRFSWPQPGSRQHDPRPGRSAGSGGAAAGEPRGPEPPPAASDLPSPAPRPPPPRGQRSEPAAGTVTGDAPTWGSGAQGPGSAGPGSSSLREQSAGGGGAEEPELPSPRGLPGPRWRREELRHRGRHWRGAAPRTRRRSPGTVSLSPPCGEERQSL